MRFLASILLALGASALGGCAQTVPLTDASTLETVPIYKLGVGDKLRITVYNEDRLSGEFTVGSDGTISFPLIGSVLADGETVEQLRAAIAGRLVAGELVNKPIVSAQLAQSRPFFIRGEIGRPGRYPAGEKISLIEAISLAGDYTYRADRRFVYLRRAGSKEEIKLLASSDFQVLPGDVIRIGERYF